MTLPAATAASEYRSEDRAILLRLYQSLLWSRLLAVLPRSLKPNTITLVAEASALLAAAAAALAVRGWPSLYLVSGVLLFLYMTGDNLDGQHARRTGQSSALGEFLDHGLDGLASCSVLLCSAFALRLEGPWFCGLAVLGSFGFGSVFWAQFRTGILVTPRISAMEGVTGASLLQFTVFAFAEPSWLRFTPGVVNGASILWGVLAVCCVYATGSPILRALRVGSPDAKFADLLAPLAVALAALGYTWAGASGLAPALLIELFVADVVCRMIRQRRRDQHGSITGPLHALLVVPLVPTLLRLVSPEGGAWIGASFAFALYARSFLGGVIEITQDARRSAPR